MNDEITEKKEERSALPATISVGNARLKEDNLNLRKDLAAVQLGSSR